MLCCMLEAIEFDMLLDSISFMCVCSGFLVCKEMLARADEVRM